MLMEGGADKRLRERGINGKEQEGPEGQAPPENRGERGQGREREGTEGTGDGEGYISMREMDSLRWRSS